MAVTARWYSQAIVGQYGSSAPRRIDWDADTIKCALLASTYSPDQDAHDFFADVSAHEVSGGGYAALTLTTTAPVYDGGSNTVRLGADDALWTSVTLTARYAAIYKDTGAAATSPLLGYVDFGADASVTNGTFIIEWDTDGVLRGVVA